MKSIILARVSTEEQKEAGNSLPAQVKRLEDYCDRKGLKIDKQFVFDESAYKQKRDEFDKALEYLKDQKETVAVCFDKVDRLSRNVFDKRVPLLYEMAQEGKIELHFTSENLVIDQKTSATEKFHFGMNLHLAKYYSDAISDNVKRAYEQKLRNGEWIGRAPIGYLNIGEEKNQRDIIVDESRRQYIKKIFDLYTSGTASMLAVKNIMATEGLRSANGKILSKSMIECILKNPFYCGTMISKTKPYPHKYEPIISRYTFEQATKIRLSKKKTPFKSISHPFIFKGLISCADCACRVTAERHKKIYNHYSCTNSKFTCKRIYINENDLLKPVYEAFNSIQLSDTQVAEITAKIHTMNETKSKYHSQAINTLRTEYDALQAQSDTLLDFMLDRSITKDVYDKKFKQIKEKQRDIELQLEDHTNADENYSLSATQLLSLAQRASDIFKSSEIEEKRQILNFIFQNLQLKGKNLLFELRSPLQALAEYKERPVMLPRLGSNQEPSD